MNDARTLIRAAMVVDGDGVCAAPGALLLDGDAIAAAGAPEAIGRPAGATVVERHDAVLLPALVNAHAHLDLTHLGPVGYGGDFAGWIDLVRAGRATTDEEIAASVRLGIAASLAGGTAFVGDIAGAGSVAPLETLRASVLRGVSFIEIFGIGARQAAAVVRMREVHAACAAIAGGVRVGLQPHAPYSCGPDVYRAAVELAGGDRAAIATHLAETPEELAFTRDASGPLADLLRRLGGMDETVAPLGEHPVDLVTGWLKGAAAPLLVHLNYVGDRHLDRLAESGASVVYCPRASAYFGHPRGGAPPHRYRAMLEAGIDVAVGTDGILCLDTPGRLSVLDDLRHLYGRDGGETQTLLRMATVNGAAALGIDPATATLRPGGVIGTTRGGILAVRIDPRAPIDPLTQVLAANTAPEWIAGPGCPFAEAPA